MLPSPGWGNPAYPTAQGGRPMQGGMPQTAGHTIPRLPTPGQQSVAAAEPEPRVARGVSGPSSPAPTPAPAPAPPARVHLPTPGELGVAAQAPAPALDWTATRRRLNELGAVTFQLQQTSGGWRFACQLRTAVAGQLHRIETAPVASEAEAVALAMAEAERWAAAAR